MWGPVWMTVEQIYDLRGRSAPWWAWLFRHCWIRLR